jgi:hypothetical protein
MAAKLSAMMTSEMAAVGPTHPGIGASLPEKINRSA